MASASKISSLAGGSVLFSASPRPRSRALFSLPSKPSISRSARRISCEATETSKVASSGAAGDGRSWIPVVPLAALPKGERRVIIQGNETILLLWYKDEVLAIENRSPAEGAYSEGLINAKLTQIISIPFYVGPCLFWKILRSWISNMLAIYFMEDIAKKDGCIICPTTDSTFDLRTGAIKTWYPNNPVLRILTPALRNLFVYPVKIDNENICISAVNTQLGESAEILFSGRAQPGVTASNVNVDEVRMVVDENVGGFGFTRQNEILNGKAALIGFLLLLDFELLTGKGILKGTGFLDFLYAFNSL